MFCSYFSGDTSQQHFITPSWKLPEVYSFKVDQLAKTLYLIVAQLIAKARFDRALDHANDLYKFIQLLKAWKSYDSEKMDKEIGSLCLCSSDLLLQGAGKLEEAKVHVPPGERPSPLCVVLDWRKLSLLFQAEANVHCSLKSLVDRTLKCGTKWIVGPRMLILKP